MNMKIKCDYCGSFISDTDEKCPNCGGVNSHLVRRAVGVPKTIEELKTWCMEQNIPLEQARFFIGEDYRGARAFGIYYDEKTENYVVYKNKSDGSRAVRYEGKDEAYAVNELYQKLKEEILNQKEHLNTANSSGKAKSFLSRLGSVSWTVLVIIMILLLGFWIFQDSGPDRGYYQYGNETYYYQPSGGWYTYDAGNWHSTSVDSTLDDHYSDYYSSDDYDSDYDTSDFSDSSYYEESSDDSYDSDWDSDDSWDSSDSWDSGYSDWDSDW